MRRDHFQGCLWPDVLKDLGTCTQEHIKMHTYTRTHALEHTQAKAHAHVYNMHTKACAHAHM